MKIKHYRFLLLFLLVFGLSSCGKPERPRLVIGENPINETVATSSLALATTTSEIQQQTEPPVEEIEVNTRIPLTIPVVSGYVIVKEKIPVLDIKMPVPETAVVVTAVSTAVVAVATTSITSSLFEPIKKKVQKFLQGKIDKWKENRKKKKDSLANLKTQPKTKNTKSKSSEHSSDSE